MASENLHLAIANAIKSHKLINTTIDSIAIKAKTVANYRVVQVWDQQASGHKYVCVQGTTEKYLIALPLSLIEFHKDILLIARKELCDQNLTCTGGGYLKIEAGRLIAYSASQEFGAYDHAIAEDAFIRASI